MGGYGSGRQRSYGAKRTVEDSLVLTVERLVREGMIRTIPWQGKVAWRNTVTGEETASARYTCTNVDGDWVFTLSYTTARRGEEKHLVRLPIRLETTEPHFGGTRWWFTCPLVRDGKACNRRVGRLYLPPGSTYFGCRHCHDLTYTSCQESHKYDALGRIIAASLGCSLAEVNRVLRG